VNHDYYHDADTKCDRCKYNVLLKESKQFDCQECGKYNICEYCFLDYMDKNDEQNTKQQNSDSDENQADGDEM